MLKTVAGVDDLERAQHFPRGVRSDRSCSVVGADGAVDAGAISREHRDKRPCFVYDLLYRNQRLIREGLRGDVRSDGDDDREPLREHWRMSRIIICC